MTEPFLCRENSNAGYNLLGLSAYLDTVKRESGGFLPADEEIVKATQWVNASGKDLFLSCEELNAAFGGSHASLDIGSLLHRERYREYLNPLKPEKLVLRTINLIENFKKRLETLLPESVKRTALLLQQASDTDFQNIFKKIKEQPALNMVQSGPLQSVYEVKTRIMESWNQLFDSAKPVYWMEDNSSPMMAQQEIADVIPRILSGSMDMEEIHSFFFSLAMQYGSSNLKLNGFLQEIFKPFDMRLSSVNQLLTKMERLEAEESSGCIPCVLGIIASAFFVMLHTVGQAFGNDDVHSIFTRFASRFPSDQQDYLREGIVHVALQKEPCEMKVMHESEIKIQAERLVRWEDISGEVGSTVQRAQVRQGTKGIHDVTRTNYIRVTVDGEKYYVQCLVVKRDLMAHLEYYLQYTQAINKKALKLVNGIIILALLATAYFCYQCATRESTKEEG